MTLTLTATSLAVLVTISYVLNQRKSDGKASQKSAVIYWSVASICCLIGSFAYPLQKLQVWRQVEKNAFYQTYTRNFVITENDVSLPDGFNSNSSKLIPKISQSNPQQKFILLVASLVGISSSERK